MDGAVGDVEVRRGGLEKMRGHCEDPLAQRAAGLADGGPGIGGDAAGEAPDAIRDRAGVAGHHVDVLVADADRIGGDLGEGGLVALSLWRRAAGHHDAAAASSRRMAPSKGPRPTPSTQMATPMPR